MTKQEVFTEVTEHLIKQGAMSVRLINGKEQGAYYGMEGLRCAVGCLIEDHMYNEAIEGKSLCTPEVKEALGEIADDEDILYLLTDLQEIHDNTPVNLWPQRFTDIANEYGLDMGRGLLYINECWDQF